jgi:hypothetical protein
MAFAKCRFEVPFNIWCSTCGEHIAKGVRFNAEKQQVGSYHSTKIWSFTMRHHCGCKITIQTDPKNAEYEVTAGAQRKVRGPGHPTCSAAPSPGVGTSCPVHTLCRQTPPGILLPCPAVHW